MNQDSTPKVGRISTTGTYINKNCIGCKKPMQVEYTSHKIGGVVELTLRCSECRRTERRSGT